MTKLALALDYTLSPGWLAPWVDGILRGKAIGRTCAGCGRVSFAPLRCCDCGEIDGTWSPLPGTATLRQMTEGSDGSFGLVRFDGSDTNTIVRLVHWTSWELVGRIRAPEGDLPAIELEPLTMQETG